MYASRSPVNLYADDNFLAEYKLSQVHGGLDLGYGFDRFSELRVGYQAGYLETNRWVGSPLLPSVSGRTGQTGLAMRWNRLDNPVVPRRGITLLAEGGWIDAHPGAKNGFPSAELTLGFPSDHQASVSILHRCRWHNFFPRETGLPLFSLGGPSRLAAYGLNQFLTDQYFYFRGGYLHRIGNAPSFLGGGVFLDVHYEVAKPYGLPSAPTLPNDGVFGLIVDTVVGPVLVGGSLGESGHRKWFFQLGRVL